MTAHDPKAELLRYLNSARDALLWKLDGLSEYAVRRPLTPTGTNLLGLVKHVAGVESEYFGSVFGRPFPETLPWLAEDAEDNADMWATADESRADVTALYTRVRAHADATVAALPLDAIGHVPWWPADPEGVTLHRVLVHVTAELNRHAGHADIVRELIDGTAGLRAGVSNLPEHDGDWWTRHRDRLERAAREAAGQD
ncbi:DinB family protein [Streptomyces avicenniae]|uniref:DinB family protein n=1 Tax=Streptomyces avicenniae TaxID=500153 RepID=UPI000699EB93|nr:DinB family protein [Streptomyces avicenniae]